MQIGPPPLGDSPERIRIWFDAAAQADIPAADGTLATARGAAEAYACNAKAANTRRAYRAGVRAWCNWCDTHALPCPACRPPPPISRPSSPPSGGAA